MRNLAAALKEHPLALFSDFRRLFAGRLISAVGDKFFSIAIAWWVISRSGANSKFQLGLVMGVTVIPVVLFGPALGTLVDRSDKRRVMLVADGARALCVFILAWLLYTDSLTPPRALRALFSHLSLRSAF
jgi:MFS family permease